MPRRRDLGFTFLLHCILHTVFTASTPHQFADTLKSFADPDGNVLFNVVVDPDNGDVYAAGLNVLYHFSSDLEMKRRVTTGPVEDGEGCPIPPFYCDKERVLQDNENGLLQMVNFLGSPPKLLVCGSVYNGLCQVRPTDNLEEENWIHPYNSSLGYNIGSEMNKAMFLRGHNEQWTLFTAHVEWEEDKTVPILTSKVLVEDNDHYYFRYPLRDDSTSSQFMISDTMVGDAVIEGFVHDEFAYFLTTIKRLSEKWQTKLMRFCPGDATFRSYAELTLICQQDNSQRTSPSAGHYGDTSSSTAKSLYVGFSTRRGTVLCDFPMSAIADAFEKAPRVCSREIFGEVCDMEVENSNVSLCGRSIDKPYIVSQPLIVQHFGIVRYGVVAFTTVKQNNDIVVIGIGRYGSVCKVKVSTGEVFAINSMTTEKLPYYGSFVVDREGDHIYLQVRNQIFKYPVGSCGAHDTYTLCLTLGQKDPLGCGWCEGRCTTQEECPHPDSFYREVREKPKLFGIRPHKGPTSGGTKVTIFGENLGYGMGKERVFSVGQRICKITGVDENTASCITGNSNFLKEDFPESIALRIEKEIYVYNGNFASTSNVTYFSHSFEYTPDPVINQLQPGFTTISGLMNVTATGLHLDSVQFPKLVVKISITPPKENFKFLEISEDCWIFPESNGTIMTCGTPPLPKRPGVRIPTSVDPLLTYVAFIMDGVKELKDFSTHHEEMSRLWYYPDPVVDDVMNVEDKSIVIMGNHLYLKKIPGFQIRLGVDYFCNIGFFSERNITCDIPSTLLSNSAIFGTNITVEVFFGYDWHQIGYTTIGKLENGPQKLENSSHLSTSLWVLFVVFVVCAIVIAIACVKYWKRQSRRRAHRIEDIKIAYSAKL